MTTEIQKQKKRTTQREKVTYRQASKTAQAFEKALAAVCILAARAHRDCTCGACDELDNVYEIIIDMEAK